MGRREGTLGWALLLACALAACGDDATSEETAPATVTPPGAGDGDADGSGGPATPVAGSTMADAGAAPTDAGPGEDAAPASPPPVAPPADDARSVHLVLERGGALRVARVVPSGGYVGPLGDPLPVALADLGDDAEPALLWARDEGPRLVVDLGDAGAYVGEGGAWTKLPDPPEGDEPRRSLVVTPDVSSALFGYVVRDTATFNWRVDVSLFAITGEARFSVAPFNTWQLQTIGAFSQSGAQVAVRNEMGIAVRNVADGSEVAQLQVFNEDVRALFETSVITGQGSYSRWLGFDGLPIELPAELMGIAWGLLSIDGAPHTEVDGTFYLIEDRALVEVASLPVGMTGGSVLGYVAGQRLLGLTLGAASDAGVPGRAYVVAGTGGEILESFEPEPSVVETDGGLTDVEWERRPRAEAWHVAADRIAVVFEVRHDYFRGAFGNSAALTEELWIVDADGARAHRLSQLPPVEGALPELARRWAFTADGEHLVWLDGDRVQALSVDTLEPAELREAF